MFRKAGGQHRHPVPWRRPPLPWDRKLLRSADRRGAAPHPAGRDPRERDEAHADTSRQPPSITAQPTPSQKPTPSRVPARFCDNPHDRDDTRRTYGSWGDVFLSKKV